MISIKKYLDAPLGRVGVIRTEGAGPARVAIDAYRSALLEMGNCSLDACPGIGNGLKNRLDEVSREFAGTAVAAALETAEKSVREELREWGRQAARHYRQKSDEVKDLLLSMAQTAEAVGARDERCAGQINAVTEQLATVASLEDLTEIRASIKRSAEELKNSVERMATEGKAAMDRLREQVSGYRTKLEEAEEIASRDALTGLRNRVHVERQIEYRVAAGNPFCVAMIDIDGFKKVNDDLGHLTGDELLKQFSNELASACRSSDVIGRWGGDEFLIALDCGLEEATSQTERLSKWICGNYTIEGASGTEKLYVSASIGLAEYRAGETMKDLLARADASMYSRKMEARGMHSEGN